MDRAEQVYALVRLARPLTLASARVVEQGLRDLGITVGMRAVMEVVAEHGPATAPGIASVLDVTRQAAQRLVDELVRRGYVEAVANPQHRRSHLIALTSSGAEVFTRVREAERQQLAALAPEVTVEDLETATRVMTQLVHDVRRRARSTREEQPHG